MGNSQSSSNDKNCPSKCCWATTPKLIDEDEWIDFSSKKKKRRKSGRKSVTKATKDLHPMPPLHEETASVEAVDANDELKSCASSASIVSFDGSSEKGTRPTARCTSDLNGDTSTSMPMPPNNVKLTFAKGQFVDLLTEEDLLGDATLCDSDGYVIRGVKASFQPGHCAILPRGGMTKQSSKLNASKLQSMLNRSVGSKFSHRSNSFDSVSTESSSSTRNTASTRSSNGTTVNDDDDDDYSKECVSSIVILGDGCFLTASKADRTIRMWRVQKRDDTKEIKFNFVRDFVGHKTGIICLEKVDNKGRFLAASKDRCVKLFDSRYNCEDAENSTERVLLGSFDKMDTRQINSIAVINAGSYVRPDAAVDWDMVSAVVKTGVKRGSMAVQRAATERHVLRCSAEFVSCSGKHRVIRVWKILQVEDQEELGPNDNVCEVSLSQDLEHDSVVESIAARGNDLILAGERMGNVVLWKRKSNCKCGSPGLVELRTNETLPAIVFLPHGKQANGTWSATRTFSWIPKSDYLRKVDECMALGITALAFVDDKYFVSGSRSGHVRVWSTEGTRKEGEVSKEAAVSITGAHTGKVTRVQKGPPLSGFHVSFSSASSDGKTLSFVFQKMAKGNEKPKCFKVVNHNTNRYLLDRNDISVTTLAPVVLGDRVALLTSTSNGYVNLIESPKSIPSIDALIAYRTRIEQESLNLRHIAYQLSRGVESNKCRKNVKKSHRDCFSGYDAVTFLVEKQFAATREDAVELAQVLAARLGLYSCIKGTCLVDSPRSLCRFEAEYLKQSLRRSRTTT